VVLGDATLPLPDGVDGSVAEGSRVVYGIRPEYTRIGGAGPGFVGTVGVLEHLGTSVLVAVETPAGDVQSVVPDGEEPEPGQTVTVVPQQQHVLLYDAESGRLL